MASVQEKLTDAVLATIRSRQDDRKKYPQVAQPVSPRTQAAVSLRVAQFSDFQNVARLSQRLGQGSDSVENWKRLWLNNPAVQSGRAVPRIGWILELDGAVVGFFGTIPLLCEFQGTTLVAAASCRFAVDPEFRSFSHLLVSSFLRQKDVDLFLNTTATPAAGKMMAASKAAPVPQEDYGTVLFWVLDCQQFLKIVFRKLGAPKSLAAAGRFAAAVALWGEMRLRGRLPQIADTECKISEYVVDELPVEFDRFCDDQIQKSKRLLGKRNAAILRWHFAPPESKKVCRVLICRDEKRITGYAVTRQELDSAFGLRRSIIADLLVEEDDPKIVQALVAAAHANAKRDGSHVLEIMGFPRSVRQALLKWKPYTREYPSCPYFFKARDRALHEKLLNVDLWYACPFDGDATLWP
jgi:hypothetical protein